MWCADVDTHGQNTDMLLHILGTICASSITYVTYPSTPL